MMMEEMKTNLSTRKSTRLRSPSPSPSPSLHQEEKDVCVCVRLMYHVKVNGPCIKWLRLKIPATLIEEFDIIDFDMEVGEIEGGGKFYVSGEGKGKGKGKETEVEMETEDLQVEEDEDKDKQESSCSDASSTEYDLLSGMVRDWREIVCGLDCINGPFEFSSLVKSQSCYTHLAACAALESVIYALGGDLDNIGDRRSDYIQDFYGFSLTNFRERAPKSRIIGPRVCGGRPSTSPSIISPKHNIGLSNVDTCHRFHLCDFSKVIPQWQVSTHPLNTPRFSPKLLSFGGKIYAFGGTHPNDEEAPFVEVYDPNLGYWESIPNPPFGRLSSCELFVFPLSYSPNILVLGPYSGISYKLDTSTWMWYPFNGCTCNDSRCPCLKNRIFGKVKRDSSPVIYGDTIYWIHRYGPLCAYKIGKDEAEGKYYEGYITGFEDVDEINLPLKQTFDFPLALLPLSKHLLALCWCSHAPLSFGYYRGSCLHISLLRVSLLREFKFGDRVEELKTPSLTASVVVSLTFPFPLDNISLIDAHLIDDEECRKLLKPCTDLEE